MVTVAIVAALGIATALTGGILGIILAGAFWGALSGALMGGIIGGITSVQNGGSFLDGFADGALSGAVTGAISGAACAGLGVLGATFGKGIQCFSTLGKVINVTSKVTKVISLGLTGFDMLALGVGLFDPNNPLVTLNSRLHSSGLYNGFQIGVNALAIFTGAASASMKCFVAGTMILTASGLVAIEAIKAGDEVISTNADTFEVAEKTVLETYIRETTELVHLTINGELIKTTYEHPFYVKEHGFVNAGELYIGDKLLDSNGSTLIVEDRKVETIDEPVKVYNFQVEDFHTYHVGENCILVHNANYIEENRVPVDNETVLKTKPEDFKPTKYKAPKGGNKVYQGRDGNYYYRDTFHKGNGEHLEVFDKRGNHLGEADPLTGLLKKGTADPKKHLKL